MLNISPIPDSAAEIQADTDPDGYHAALRTADNIMKFWRNAGFDVEARVYRHYVRHGDAVWCVRTDLENGRPRQRTGQARVQARIKRLSEAAPQDAQQHALRGDHA